MDGQPKRQWGVTDPISEAQPTEADLKLNDQLIEALKANNNFESPEQQQNRIKVLEHLQKVTEEFVRRACKAKGLPASTIDSAGGRVFTFGSYALGVHNPDSDIDTLLIAPKHVNLDDFFQFLPPTFREMSSEKDINELNPVPDAFVPIISIEYCGVPIDLLFVSLPTMSSIPRDFDPKDRSNLKGLTDDAIRSINGTRVTKELLDSVPQPKSFRLALRAVKLWSNRRAIYGAVYGFPGGIAWAIMVARISQLYPFACGATILTKFFNLMMKWHWPRPVMLKNIDEGAMGLRVWNPQIYPQDKFHLMPIITPAFPSMCSTHTIGQSTKAIMLDEFKRADGILAAIQNGKKTWSDLFEGHTFFASDHKYYLSIIAATRGKAVHDNFAGLVRSKVRLLVKGIEEGNAGVDLARPYYKEVERCHRCETEDEVEEVAKGVMKHQITKEQAAEVNGDADKHIIYTSTYYVGLKLPEVGGKSLDISYPVADFKRYITDADNYDAEIMSLRVVHTRNYDLPDDLFEPGKPRPEKPKKKGKKLAPAVKRTQAQAGLDASDAPSKRREAEINGHATPTPA